MPIQALYCAFFYGKPYFKGIAGPIGNRIQSEALWFGGRNTNADELGVGNELGHCQPLQEHSASKMVFSSGVSDVTGP